MKKLGSHKGIDLLESTDGVQIYYSTGSNTSGMAISAIARLLNCTTTSASIQLTKGTPIPYVETYFFTVRGKRKLKVLHQSNFEAYMTKVVYSNMEQAVRDRAATILTLFKACEGDLRRTFGGTDNFAIVKTETPSMETQFDAPFFAELAQQGTRQDGYVNATYWCQEFGKEFYQFNRKTTTQKLLEVTAQKYHLQKTQLMQTKHGGGSSPSETWVHPVIAIALAEWLSPEFNLFVKEIFKRYLEADPSLAVDIINRQTSQKEAAKITNAAVSHEEYLESDQSLREEVAHRPKKWVIGRLMDNTNKQFGIPNGGRPEAFASNPNIKKAVTAIQNLQAINLETDRLTTGSVDSQRGKIIGYKTTKGVMEILDMDYVKPTDFYKLPPADQDALMK